MEMAFISFWHLAMLGLLLVGGLVAGAVILVVVLANRRSNPPHGPPYNQPTVLFPPKDGVQK